MRSSAKKAQRARATDIKSSRKVVDTSTSLPASQEPVLKSVNDSTQGPNLHKQPKSLPNPAYTVSVSSSSQWIAGAHACSLHCFHEVVLHAVSGVVLCR